MGRSEDTKKEKSFTEFLHQIRIHDETVAKGKILKIKKIKKKVKEETQVLVLVLVLALVPNRLWLLEIRAWCKAPAGFWLDSRPPVGPARARPKKLFRSQIQAPQRREIRARLASLGRLFFFGLWSWPGNCLFCIIMWFWVRWGPEQPVVQALRRRGSRMRPAATERSYKAAMPP